VTASVILVGSADRALEALVRECAPTVTSVPGSDLANLAQGAAKQPDVVMIDLRGQSHVPAALPLLRRQHPATGVVIVASQLDPALMLEAMRAGVTECIVEPLTRAEVEAAISRVVVHRPAAALPVGKVFAFVGAKGGVGATTTSVNTATVLAHAETGRTLLADLHFMNGDAAVFLGAEPRFSVVDALENIHRLDEAFFRTLVLRTKAGVDLLASAERTVVTPIDSRRIRMLLEFAATHYRFVVLDVPRSDTTVLDSLEIVDKIIVVANQELATVRSASRMATSFRQRYGKDKVWVVVSRSDRLAEIGHDDVERAIGGPVKFTFPSDYRLALQALNQGKPITLDNHNELSASFQKFARGLAGLADVRAAAAPVGLIGRLTGRR
jgi:pilus assembly protein CpaE